MAHAIYLKSLKIQDQFNFDLILKKTAILSSRRKLIFNWIENKENNLFKILERPSSPIKVPKSNKNLNKEIDQKKVIIEDEPKMNFVDWVLSYNDREKKDQGRPLESKIDIIDSFLEKNPKITNREYFSDCRSFQTSAIYSIVENIDIFFDGKILQTKNLDLEFKIGLNYYNP